MKLAFDGIVANRTSMMMEGTLTVDTASLRDALRWTGQAPPGRRLWPLRAEGARQRVGASDRAHQCQCRTRRQCRRGRDDLCQNGRQSLQATLAADTLDFTPYISTFRLLASGAHDWNRQLFDLNSLSTTDLDMRLSAARVTVGTTKLGRTAFGANLRGGALALQRRRGAGLWRHRQGLVRARAHRHHGRRQGPVPVHRAMCKPAPANCSASPS